MLAQLFPKAKGLRLVEDLIALERSAGFAPDPMARFLALFWKDAAAVHEAANALKMSNEERQRLNWSAKNETLIQSDMSAKHMRRALYGVGEIVFRDRVLLQWAQDKSPAWSKVYSDAAAYVRPAMPVSGEDLLVHGIAEGPAIGEALRKLEADWIDSDFTLGQDELLARL